MSSLWEVLLVEKKTELLTLFPKSKQACTVFFKPFEIRLVKRKMVNFLKTLKTSNGFGRRRNATSLKSFDRWDLSLF